MVCGTSQITTKVHLFRTHHNVFNYLNFFCVWQIVHYSRILGPFHPSYFFLLSHIFYTFVCLTVHSKHPCKVHNALPYKFHINYIQLFQYIYFLQFPLHTASFHTAFHIIIFTYVFIFYLIKVSMGLIHSTLGSFITTHITLFFLYGLLILKLTTCTIFLKIPAFI